jgi:sulfur carrier protein
MQITLNGTLHTIPPNSTLLYLLRDTKLEARRIAVEVNEQIIPRAQHAECILSEGDRVEIIHAVGGG